MRRSSVRLLPILSVVAAPSWATLLTYDFYLQGTTTVEAELQINGFLNPSNLPVNGFTGFISPAALIPCNLSTNASAELDCAGTSSPFPTFTFTFAERGNHRR